MAIVQCRKCGSEASEVLKTCPRCGESLPRSSTGFVVGLLVIIGVGVVGTWLGSRPAKTDDYPQLAAQRDAAAASARRASEAASCRDRLPSLRQEYEQLTASGKHWDASLSIRSCAALLGDQSLSGLVASAEQRSHLQEMADLKRTSDVRLRAISMLERDYPAVAKENAAAIAKARESALAAGRVEEKKAAAAELARRKKEGVTVGMTKEEVLQSMWGRPQHVNRTTYSFGVHEQWVYSSGNYLYFEDDKLTSIQTSGAR